MLIEKYPFKLSPLQYGYDALEPYIDAETVMIHHNKHLNSYVEKLNKIIDKNPKFKDWTLGDLIKRNDLLPKDLQEDIKNNACGIYAHNFYFDIMKPSDKKCAYGNLKMALCKKYKTVDNFIEEFIQSGLNRFASGWAWLVNNCNGEPFIISTPYHDVPFNVNRILLVDVWEHAYYLKYQNKRADYLKSWVNLINWEKAEHNYNRNEM